jgi:hypothetical protein
MPGIKTVLTCTELIAPCGINCRLCRRYAKEKAACPGCRGDDSLKMPSCIHCRIKNCESLAAGNLVFCSGCERFPCVRLIHLDKRYRTKYGTSPITNLQSIETIGVANFVDNENREWLCPRCGMMICMHEPACLSCGYSWQEKSF